jgi:pimeloyl-ACP methyl ester carboxylesterase
LPLTGGRQGARAPTHLTGPETYTEEEAVKRIILLLTLLLLATQPSQAQKKECLTDACKPPKISPTTTTLAAPAPGPISSPFPPETPTDHRFIINGAPTGLDTTCTFRNGGPLRIELPINRVVGNTDGQGKLTNPAGLLQNGIIKKNFVTLSMPAFDVDVNPPSGLPPEVDTVFFNGEQIGQLTGDNNIWKENTWPILIDKVRFGIKGSNGAPSTPGINVIEIHIDQASGSALNWCTAIDWAEIIFEAAYPVVMVHGNGQDSGFWQKFNFTQPFADALYPFDATISLSPKSDSISQQSTRLAAELKKRADQFGVKHIHIVAHSKGGLDTRDFLAHKRPADLGVLSLITLSTPHHGSVGADYVLDAKQADLEFDWPDNEIEKRTLLARAIGFFSTQNETARNATEDMRPRWVDGEFNPENRPKLPYVTTVDGETNEVFYYSFGADANVNRSPNHSIESSETEGVEVFGIPLGGFEFVRNTVEEVYHIMGEVKSVDVVQSTTKFNSAGEPLWVIKENRYKGGFRLNDFLVTVDSAHLPRFTPQLFESGNHATVTKPGVAAKVLRLIRGIPSF